jgi:hypothetical protein
MRVVRGGPEGAWDRLPVLRWRIVILCIALTTILARFDSSPTAHAQDPIPPDPRFGAVEAYHAPELADRSGVGWERIIFYWSELERDGPDDWNEFHAPLARIDREIEGGREVVGLIQDTPAWATDGLPGVGVPRGLYLPVDDPGNLWANFIREVVSAYRGRVDRWIIWNEPDISLDDYGAQWQGSTADYYQLLKVAYLAAHQANPDVQIHLGGLTYWHNPDYLRELLAVASQDSTAAEHGYYFDVVSVHIYFKPDTTLDILAALHSALDEYGLQKPIWVDETNAPPYDDPAQEWDEPVFFVTQQMQASYLIQEFALALASGAERVGVYKWIDEPPRPPGFEPYGLLRTGGEPRPAFDAFLVITRYYAGTEEALYIDHPDVRHVVLDRGARTTQVIWARPAARLAAAVPALSRTALAVDQSGAERTIRSVFGYYLLILDGAPCEPGEECLMGGPPLVIVEQAPADLATWKATMGPVRAVTLRTLARAAGLAVALLAIGLGGGIVWRRRGRRAGGARAESSRPGR